VRIEPGILELEGDMDAAYVSALSALGGATIGGLASFGSSWLTQRTQLRFAHHEAIKAKREALYAEFVDEASRLYGDALGHQKDEVADLVKIYALIGRIRLVAPRPVVYGCRADIGRNQSDLSWAQSFVARGNGRLPQRQV
jgi:hypothetical protein